MRLLPRLFWHLGVILAVVAAAALPFVVVYAVVLRFVFDDPGFDEPLVDWLLEVAVLVSLWWFELVPWCRKQIDIWRNRNGRASEAYRRSVGEIGDSGSPGSKIVSKILVIPFILLLIGMIIMMIVGVLSI